MNALSPSKSLLQNLHLYPKVPSDLTDATRVGGVLSLACAVLMAYLFISNIASYMSMTTTTDVALDDNAEVHMRLFFNITMERLPCQFASVDLHDVMGTSLTNVTKDILKFRVAKDADHKQEFYVEAPRAVTHEQLSDAEVAALNELPNLPQLGAMPQLTHHNFDEVIQNHDLVLVAFGAPWCPWSQRLEPIWKKTFEELKTQPFASQVRMGKVDCTAEDAQRLCQMQHIHAFPTIRVYRHKFLHSHENYLGDRDTAAFLDFLEESLPTKRDPCN